MNKEQAYKILNLDARYASAKEVETKYRELLHSHHPDKGGTREAFAKLQNARRAALGEPPVEVASNFYHHSHGGENYHRHFVSSKTFPRHLKFMLGSLVIIVCGLNAAKINAKERKEKRSPGVRAALGLGLRDANSK
jgi:hypothetical protein